MIILLFILSLFVADVAGAATYWVSPSGNDGNQHCFNSTGLPALSNTSRTIKQGTNCLNGGDTLNILTGTYTEDLIAYIDAFQNVPNGSAGAYTTVQAYCPSGVCTTPDGSYGPASGANVVTLNGQIYLYNLNYVQLKNIKVGKAATSTTGSFDGIILGGAAAHHLKVDGVEVTGTCRTGPGCTTTSRAIGLTGPDMWVTHTNVHDSAVGESESHTHCWYVEADRALVEWSTCHDWGIGAAIHHYTGAASITGGVFRNLLVYNLPNYMPLVLWNGTNVTAYNIVGYNNQEAVNFNSCTGCSLYNSTFVGSTSGSIPVIEINSGSDAIIRNVIVSGNANATSFGGTGAGAATYSNNMCSSAGTGCATVEPSTTTFVNFAARDLHLKAGSAAINGGTPTGCPATDFTGAARVGTCDVGAYEAATPGVASVNWTSNRGGPLDSIGQTGPNSGAASLIGSNWTISNIPLSAGINNLVVTYTDTASVQTTDNLVVTYAPTFPGNTLAGAWSFDNVTTDSSGNVPPNNATLLNGATYGAGRFGASALSLDGVNDYALVGDANSLDFTQSFTFSAWVFPTAVQTDYRAAITKNYMIALYASSPQCGAGTPVIYMRVNGQSGPDYYACYANPLPPNQWTHLAGTYDGSNLRLYTDGVLRTTTAASGYIEPSALSMQIGASIYPNEYFQGRIDEARVYNWGIPLTAGSNTTPGAACTQQNYADNASNPSIIGNMNCGIVQVTTPVTIKFPASATSLKVGAASGVVKFGQAGQ